MTPCPHGPLLLRYKQTFPYSVLLTLQLIDARINPTSQPSRVSLWLGILIVTLGILASVAFSEN